jgi:putative heme transporter
VAMTPGAPEDELGSRRARTSVRVGPASVLAIVGAVVVAIVIRNIFVAAHRTIGWAVAAALVAMLLAPLVDRLDRRLPRLLALVVTVVGFALATGVLWAGARHEILTSAERIQDEAPEVAADLEAEYRWAEQADLAARVDDLIAAFEPPSAGAQASEVAGTAFAYVVPTILTLFLIIYGPRMLEGALRLLPEAQRAGTRRIFAATVTDVRIQVAYAGAEAVVVGTVIGVVAQAFGLPAPLMLGVIAGLLSVVPVMGIIIGALPATLLALGLESVVAALVVLGVALVLDLTDVLVVRPRVRARAGEVGPALTLLVTLIAFDLYGIGGAIYGFLGLVFLLTLVREIGLRSDPVGVGP